MVAEAWQITEPVFKALRPNRIPAGTAELNWTPPVTIGDLLFRICNGVQPLFDVDSIHV
jgi:hypothetical protein